MTGFELITKEIKDFESSSLYAEKFAVFISSIAKHKKGNPVKSSEIEKALDISGPAVRSLVRYARLKKYKIASDETGYWYAINAFEITDTVKHLRERSAIMAILANCLEQPSDAVRDQLQMGLL